MAKTENTIEKEIKNNKNVKGGMKIEKTLKLRQDAPLQDA